MQSSKKLTGLEKADVAQLNKFLGDIASNRISKAVSRAERDHCAEIPLAGNSQESDQRSEEESEDDDDEYSTIHEDDFYDDDDVTAAFKGLIMGTNIARFKNRVP